MVNKLALLGASSVVVGAAGVSVYKFYDSPKSLKKLKDLFDSTKGRVLLDAIGDKHDSVWTQILAEHSQSNNKISGVDSKEKLKSYCRDTGESVKESDLEIYSSWCSRNTFRTQINTSIPKATWIDSQDSTAWSKNKEDYSKQTSQEVLIPKLNASGDIAKGKLTLEQLRDFCNSKKDEPFLNDQNDIYTKVKRWCTTTAS
ncbi:hypothetical protein MHF_0640 [Mycoplasma haemofelis Ohio2]|uniref:Uncharacterized protein n=1 Tax=Mycoplasma haemofelis (strain Ohio2) TaxID=859194 RepID=F6FI64_MYCHI|nr:hypothetical protein MHF_0640 [Mycoplasma haemofelis Ohio2]